MARGLRIERVGGWYHLTARGNERRNIYRDDRDRRRSRQGLGDGPTAEQVRERLAWLRGYRWSSYRAYVGLERPPAWLERDAVYALGGGGKAEQPKRYRDYVEREVREGMKETLWESLRDQVILGSQEFLAKLGRDGNDSAVRRRLEKLNAARPDWTAIVAMVERVKKARWEEIRDRHGDTGRELAMHLGRGMGGLSLEKLAELAGLTSAAAVAM